MRHPPGLLVTLLVATIALTSPSALAAPQPDAAAPPAAPVVKLHGAFGIVVGGTPDAPARAYPGVPLDTWIRNAPLRVVVGDEVPGAVLLAVTAEPVAGGPRVTLSEGDARFDGPGVVGESVVTASVRGATGVVSRHAWLVEVPDHAGGEEALFEIVPPAVLLGSAAGEVRGTPGNGCYAYLCSDIGGLGPIANLDPLAAGAGETLTARTADGSGLSGWVGRLRRADDLAADPIDGDGAQGEDPRSLLDLVGLEIPAPGEWILELRVDFDRERGWTWHAYRLVAE